MKTRFLLIGWVLSSFFVSEGFGQARKCGTVDDGIKYKVLLRDTSEAPAELFMEVHLDPESFSVAPMIQLAKRLQAEYCDYDIISVRFYDTKKVDRMPDPPPHPLFEWKSKTPFVGFFELDRRKNRHELAFREKLSGKTITIEFSPDGYCISED